MSSAILSNALRKNGLLMLSDPALPSVVRLIAGPGVKGSWWGHPKGHEIFRKLEWFESDPDVLATRLVSGKVTFLHRRLWADFISAATAREKWQLEGLGANERRLLKSVDSEGEIKIGGAGARRLGESARDIERRLLAYGEEIHTETGAHAKILMTWSRCPKIRNLKLNLRRPAEARASLAGLLDDLNRRYRGSGRLPWRQN